MCGFALVRLAQEYLGLLFRNRKRSLAFELNADMVVGNEDGDGTRTVAHSTYIADFVRFMLPLLPALPKVIRAAPQRTLAAAVAAPVPAPDTAMIPSAPFMLPGTYNEADAVDACKVVLSTLARTSASENAVFRFLNALTIMAVSHQRRDMVPLQWTDMSVPDKLPAVPVRACVNAVAQAMWSRTFILATQNMLLSDA